ncbi:MAG: hypothetical protein PUP92_07175, partial [Rhizonema sp. PD38]|nr:hypothetical protein [Rhizonema sp. PD38]
SNQEKQSNCSSYFCVNPKSKTFYGAMKKKDGITLKRWLVQHLRNLMSDFKSPSIFAWAFYKLMFNS